MALAPVLLGFLETPASGYDVKKLFEESVLHFWDAELSQIYPTLHRMRARGLVEVSTEPSSRGPDRKVYRRTPAGTDELLAWLSDGPTMDTERVTHLAQLFFLGQAESPARTRRFLEDLRDHFARRLEALRAIHRHHVDEGEEHPADLTAATLHPYLTLLNGLRKAAATVEWCEESLALLTALDGAPPELVPGERRHE